MKHVRSRRMVSLMLVLTLLVSMGWISAPAAQAAPQANYDWSYVPQGGGGAVPGIVAHPKANGLFYSRTDVGGAYRWDQAESKWVQLLNGMAAPDDNLMGVAGLAIDPSDNTANTVYAAVGKAAYANWSKGQVLKSTDRGKTWTDTGIRKWEAANWSQSYGEKLVVDPNNGQVVYYGSREGLHRTLNGASSWENVTTAPTGDTSCINSCAEANWGSAASGILFVAVDASSGTTGTPARSKVVYIGANNDGIYRTDNGGASWSKISNMTNFHRAIVNASGELFVTTSTGLWKYSGGNWSNVSPAGLSNSEFMAIAIDYANPSKMLVAQHWYNLNYNTIHYSDNGGQTWTAKNNFNLNKTVSWLPDDHFGASLFALTFDPFNSNQVWFTDWYEHWHTTNITAATPTWTARETGHEEMVNLDLISPSAGNAFLISGVADNGGFVHTSFSNFPTQRITDLGLTSYHNITGLDFQETNPNFIAAVSVQGWGGNGGGGAYSTNGGQSFTNFPTVPPGYEAGKIAVSANSETMLWVAGGIPYYSTNRGTSWQASTGITDAGGGGIWAYDKPVASDRVTGNKFYVYKESEGKVYVSTNGGASFSAANATALNKGKQDYHQIAAAPGKAGHVWIAINGSGLYKSDNSASSFTKIGAFQDARYMAFGKEAPGSSDPAVYVYGQVDNRWGIYRSTNYGVDWVEVTNSANSGVDCSALAADRQVFGRVYVGTGGRGVLVGSENGTGASSLIENGSFNGSTSPWTLQTYGADAALYGGYGTGIINVASGGDAAWRVNLSQNVNGSMNAGTAYTIKFDIGGSGSRTIDAVLVDKDTGYTHWAAWSVNVETYTQNLSYSFTPSSNLSNLRLEFRAGGSNEDVYLSNISIANQ